MYRAVEVVPLADFRLLVRFEDGVGGVVDLQDQLFGTMFEPLRDVSFFEQATIDEYGAVCWPNGADLAPNAMHENLKSALKETTPSHLASGSQARRPA